MQLSIEEVVIRHATPVRQHLLPLFHLQIKSYDSTFNVLQLNANGIGNKLTELGEDPSYNSTQSSIAPHPYWTAQTPRGTCTSRETDIAMAFNQRKPPDCTVCVAVDLSAAFDTVSHNKLLSKIDRSHLSLATSRWLSCYLRGRHAKTWFRGVKSPSRNINTDVPQGSKLSPYLFSFYIADMSMPTEPVNRVCYADDLTVWATGVKIPDMEDSLNSYLEEITAYLKDNSLLISAPKLSVTLFTPDTHQAKTHPKILIYVSQLPLVQCPKILGVPLETSTTIQ